jgi:hypothetical protein
VMVEDLQRALQSPLPDLHSLSCSTSHQLRLDLSSAWMNGVASSLTSLSLRRIYLSDTTPAFPSLTFLSMQEFEFENNLPRLLRVLRSAPCLEDLHMSEHEPSREAAPIDDPVYLPLLNNIVVSGGLAVITTCLKSLPVPRGQYHLTLELVEQAAEWNQYREILELAARNLSPYVPSVSPSTLHVWESAGKLDVFCIALQAPAITEPQHQVLIRDASKWVVAEGRTRAILQHVKTIHVHGYFRVWLPFLRMMEDATTADVEHLVFEGVEGESSPVIRDGFGRLQVWLKARVLDGKRLLSADFKTSAWHLDRENYMRFKEKLIEEALLDVLLEDGREVWVRNAWIWARGICPV